MELVYRTVLGVAYVSAHLPLAKAELNHVTARETGKYSL